MPVDYNTLVGCTDYFKDCVILGHSVNPILYYIISIGSCALLSFTLLVLFVWIHSFDPKQEVK